MENALQALLSWQFVLFCLGIFAITFVLRKVAEYILDNPKVPMSKASKLWTELLLPIKDKLPKKVTDQLPPSSN